MNSRVGMVGLELPDPLASAPATRAVRPMPRCERERPSSPDEFSIPMERHFRARASLSLETRRSRSPMRRGDSLFAISGLGRERFPFDALDSSRQRWPWRFTLTTPSDVTVRLGQFVPVLDTVLVVARQDRGLERVGFSRRKKSGLGYYITPDVIENRHAYDLPSLLTRRLCCVRLPLAVALSSPGAETVSAGDA
jgi:hypothetical protein